MPDSIAPSSIHLHFHSHSLPLAYLFPIKPISPSLAA